MEDLIKYWMHYLYISHFVLYYGFEGFDKMKNMVDILILMLIMVKLNECSQDVFGKCKQLLQLLCTMPSHHSQGQGDCLTS